MNNRIKQLEPQCWEHNEFGLNFNYQKFAELIVRECVEVCEALKDDDGFDANFARTTCANEIREHFGVEE